MREIKFRLWDGERMEYDPSAWCESINESLAYADDVDAIIMQHTGLLDKNGKEIYEFDYLGDYCVFWGSGQYILQNISTGDIIICNENTTNGREVTGNRYETPREHKAMETDL